MDINILVNRKLMLIKIPATIIIIILLRLGVVDLLVISSKIKPMPPIMNKKLDAIPSMMNCPLTRSRMNATFSVFHIMIYIINYLRFNELNIF